MQQIKDYFQILEVSRFELFYWRKFEEEFFHLSSPLLTVVSTTKAASGKLGQARIRDVNKDSESTTHLIGELEVSLELPLLLGLRGRQQEESHSQDDPRALHHHTSHKKPTEVVSKSGEVHSTILADTARGELRARLATARGTQHCN